MAERDPAAGLEVGRSDYAVELLASTSRLQPLSRLTDSCIQNCTVLTRQPAPVQARCSITQDLSIRIHVESGAGVLFRPQSSR